MKTLREFLTEKDALDYYVFNIKNDPQVIEVIVGDVCKYVDDMLDLKDDVIEMRRNIISAFLWSNTKEGWEYWKNLNTEWLDGFETEEEITRELTIKQ